MDPIFTEEQLNRMSRDDMLSLVKIMQGHYQKQKETLEKQETRIQLLEEKTKELEFLNAMLSDRLTVYYDDNVPLFRRNGYRKSGTMILRVRSRDTALN